jgi:D-beta-D-heptose 7-phosphate kinase/D-beta-D-heptose 1-phosphate adenosyltransferase
VKRRRSLKSKILSPSKAAAVCNRAARAGKRVVFTNGCFDILHPGHVSYLEAARGKGDFLVVALDTDQAVRKLKGPTRPVNPLESRLQVIAALESVDAVTWFDGGDPRPVIKKLRPRVLVKGGDWKVDQILGSKEVLSWGGKVHSLKYVAGKSTTNIIKKIREK